MDEKPALEDKLHRVVKVQRVLLPDERRELDGGRLLGVVQVLLDLAQVGEERIEGVLGPEQVRTEVRRSAKKRLSLAA